MPRLSDSMEEGTILKWLKDDGQSITKGDDLVEIETDKATMTYAAEVAGVLHIVAAEGTTLPVGATIGRVGELAAPAAQSAAADQEPATASAPASNGNEARAGEVRVASPREGDASAPVGAARGPQPAAPVGAAKAPQPAAPVGAAQAPQPAATPLARRVAREHSVDLTRLYGTGPRGRITRADVLAASRDTAPPATVSAAVDAKGPLTIEQPTRLQRAVARRMSDARATIPAFEIETEVCADEAIAIRERLKQLAGDEGAPSFNDLVIKACALSLRRHPKVNASVANDEFHLHGRINIGFAVAADDALIVPTVFDADTKALGEIARETRYLAARVRAGEITPPEISGGTFTVSNLGMFGMTAIRPVINPPQAAILGVGAIRQVLARVNAEIVDRALATLTLSGDHRILYGADAAKFLAEVRGFLESPLKLAL